MKKKILYVAMLVAGLTSCTEDYTDWKQPAQNTQQEQKTQVLMVTPVADVIDLDVVETETVQVVEFGAFEGATFVDATFHAVQDDNSFDLPVAEDGTVQVADLKKAISSLYSRTREVRDVTGKVKATLKTLPTEAQPQSLTLYVESEAAVTFQAELPDTPTYCFLTGNPNGWATDPSVPFIPTLENKNVQTLTTYFNSSWDGKLWYREDVVNWDVAMGAEKEEPLTEGKIVSQNVGCFFAPSEGFYTMTIDIKNMTYRFTECEEQFPAVYDKIGLIGDFNGWGGDYELTQAKESHVWHAYDFTLESDTKLKFRANGAWDINWGNASDFPYGQGVQGGSDLPVSAGTYDVYFNDLTGQYLFIEK